MIEAGFLNSDQDNERFDSKFEQISQAIADGIMETIGSGNEALQGIYRVQIGLYRNFSNAQYALNRAVADGYEGDIVYEDPYYAVQIGEYNTLDEAVRLENELKKKDMTHLLSRNNLNKRNTQILQGVRRHKNLKTWHAPAVKKHSISIV